MILEQGSLCPEASIAICMHVLACKVPCDGRDMVVAWYNCMHLNTNLTVFVTGTFACFPVMSQTAYPAQDVVDCACFWQLCMCCMGCHL